MAEAERYLPVLIEKIEDIVDENGLRDKEITIRMTGCPNGCARPAFGEIGFIGKAPGKYNMYLGAAFDGSRLSKMYRENIGEEEILNELRVFLPHYAKEREEDEHFGDFVIRAGVRSYNRWYKFPCIIRKRDRNPVSFFVYRKFRNFQLRLVLSFFNLFYRNDLIDLNKCYNSFHDY